MQLDLNEEQADTLAIELRDIIDRDRFPFSQRTRTLKEILVSEDLTLETSCRDFSFMRAPG